MILSSGASAHGRASGTSSREHIPRPHAVASRSKSTIHMLLCVLCVLGLLGISSTACHAAAQRPSASIANNATIQSFQGPSKLKLAPWPSVIAEPVAPRNAAALRAAAAPLTTRTPGLDVVPEAQGGSGGVRRILMAKKGTNKAKLLASLPRCSRCAIQQCFRNRKTKKRSRCTGKCKRRGRIFNCSSTKGDFKTCTRSGLGQCWRPTCEPYNLPLEPLIPLAGVVAFTPAPYVPCIVTTNHPTGCPAAGSDVAGTSGPTRLVASECISYEYRLASDGCESPYLPFGYCECRFTEQNAASGTAREVTRPCHFGDFDSADLPLTSTAPESSDGAARIQTRLPANSSVSGRPHYTYNTTLVTDEGPVDVKMEYFRRISVLADRFTYTGEYADDDSGGSGDGDAADTDPDYVESGFPAGVYDETYTSVDYGRRDDAEDYVRLDYDYLDYFRGYGDYYRGYERYESYDFRRDYSYYDADDQSRADPGYSAIVGIDDSEEFAAAYDYTVDEEADEYYFAYNKYNLDPERQDCDLKCSFEGGGVLGSVREEYGVQGAYSVYYMSTKPVPSANCPACLPDYGGPPDGAVIDIAPGTPLEPGEFEVFLGDVPEEERFEGGEEEVFETPYT